MTNVGIGVHVPDARGHLIHIDGAKAIAKGISTTNGNAEPLKSIGNIEFTEPNTEGGIPNGNPAADLLTIDVLLTTNAIGIFLPKGIGRDSHTKQENHPSLRHQLR